MGGLVPGTTDREPGRAPPHTVREAREALGWTQERLAEEIGVLPAEVAAWESGAIALTPYRAAEVRWRMERAAYEAALPRSDCYWTRANAERLERLAAAAPHLARRARREREAHARECTDCLRVKALLRDAPPPPEPPLRPGPAGWMEAWRRYVGSLPVWLRVPVRAADMLLRLAVLFAALPLLRRVGLFEHFDLSFPELVMLGAGFAWFFKAGELVDPLGDRHPFLAGLLHVLAVVVPALLGMGLLGIADLAAPGPWAVAAMIVVLGGAFFGIARMDGQSDDARTMDPEAELGPEEEREVFIPQRRDGYWRP